MKRSTLLLGALGLLWSCVAIGQDAMQYGLTHLKVPSEDEKVGVLKYSPEKGNQAPMHFHPSTIVYVIKGGKLRFIMPDGSTREAEFKTGDALLRPPVTHADEALDDLEVLLVELKK